MNVSIPIPTRSDLNTKERELMLNGYIAARYLHEEMLVAFHKGALGPYEADCIARHWRDLVAVMEKLGLGGA